MNWEDELIEDCREDDGTLHPQTDHVLSGAHWMLRRLRTDEAIERMAVVIYEAEDPLANAGWAFESEDLKDTYRAWAKDQITALLGED